MKTIKFECEVVTPMFLAGADGRTPELRPPSIKGTMRFWWRAMNGHLPLEKLKEEEAEIFGGSEENESRSKISICIPKQPIAGDIIENLWQEIPYVEKTSRSGKKYKVPTKYEGVPYLLYSSLMLNERPYIRTKISFLITISSSDAQILKHAAASFWSLAYLGGIGTRARRGGGNITIKKVVDKDNIVGDTGIDFLIKGKDSNKIAEWLKENYDRANRIVNDGKGTRFISEYSNLSISRFIISNQSFNDWKEALNNIGEKFLNFREDGKGDIFGMAIFGFPVLHRNRRTTIVGGKVQNNKLNEISRRSSPLIFKVLKSEGKYYWMALRLAGEFLPEGQVMIAKQRNNQPANYRTRAPSFDKFDEFWNGLKKEAKEYILSKPDELKKIKENIDKELSPKKTILFGSKARGDFHKNSDIDIAIDTDKSIELANINGPVDIVNLNKIDKSFREKIEQEGVEI